MDAVNWSRWERTQIRAYYKWLNTGRPPVVNWLEAEKEIGIEDAVADLALPAAEKYKVQVSMRPGYWKEGSYIPTINLWGKKDFDPPWHVVMKDVHDAVLVEVGYEISRDPPR